MQRGDSTIQGDLSSRLVETDLVNIEVIDVKASKASACFNITNCTVGAGVLGLPYTFRRVGLLSGVVMLLLMALLADYSLKLLLYTAEMTRATVCQTVAAATYGKMAVRLVDLAVFFQCFSALVGYFIIIGDLVPGVLTDWLGTDVDRKLLVGLVAFLVVLPLSLAKTLDFLRHTSLVALVCVLYLLVLVVAWAFHTDFDDVVNGNQDPDTTPPPAEVTYAIWDTGIIFCAPIFAYAYTSHTQVYQIYQETGLRSVPEMMTVVHVSVAICTALYMIVGVFGYVTFYDVVDGNIFNNYPTSNVAVAVGKIGLAITLIFSAPLFSLPLRDTIKSLLFTSEKASEPSRLRDGLLTVTMVSIAYLLAIFLPDISVVFALTGSTACSSVMYIFPATFYLALRDQLPLATSSDSEDDPKVGGGPITALLARGVQVFGVVLLIAGTVVSVLDSV